MKSLEQRIYEAFHRGDGMKLSAKDVENLMRDDAIDTRICNKASEEAGNGEVGYATAWVSRLTWEDFVDSFTSKKG